MTPSSLTSAPAVPIRLGPNTPHRFYRGGGRILAFRGLDAPDGFDGYRPEDWLASTTRLFAEGGDGVTVLPDGTDLATALEADPLGWLGPDHVAVHGAEPGILTKLLDAGERLPVHSHPDRGFAARHLDCAHGKTEAWIVLEADPGATVWLGFREDLGTAELDELVEAQDERLLAALNPLQVSRGDTVLVPAGQPHAIGEGVFVLEIQEPTDLSVMLEHERFGLEPAHAFLGLPRPVALDSVARQRLDDTTRAALRSRWDEVAGTGPALPDHASEFFRAEVVRPTGAPVTVAPGFAVTVVVGGVGTITTATGEVLAIRSGDVLLVPHAARELRVEGDVTLIRCLPPSGAAAPTEDQPSGTRAAPEPTRLASERQDGGQQ
jgi:mannose-6-phosphate isomerase